MARPKKPNLDSVTTINDDGSHYFLHPADVQGNWVRARRWVGIGLIAVFFVLPWISIGGNPAVFLDIEQRMFHLFGFTLQPQDLWVMFFAVTGLGFGLFFITSIFGRVWCGWSCPYTVFLDHVYRRIERWIDGDAVARRALDREPWDLAKIARRGVKHAAYVVISTAIAFGFMAYFVSWARLGRIDGGNMLEHATVLGFLAVLTLTLWFCFGYFREQFCIIMCPYGRLQSALTDDDTIHIGYDDLRGEPRGAKGKTTGDCVDCGRCIQVCPTGIDIRNGLQLECIGCTACIDACNDVMVRVGRPKGLIRYDSLNGFAGKRRRLLRPRVYVYSALAILGLGSMVLLTLSVAKPFNATVSRLRGAPFLADANSVRNLYQLRFFNKRNQEARVRVTLGPGAPTGYQVTGSGLDFTVAPLGEVTRTCMLVAPMEAYTGAGDVTLEIQADPGQVTLSKTVRFLGPNPHTLRRQP